MKGGSTSVSDLKLLQGKSTELFVVHAEPGNDKITFANEVADWILARVDQGPDQPPDAVENRSKL